MNNPVQLVTVESVTRVTPRMARVTFKGEGLSKLRPWPDQQLKLLFPPEGRTLVLPEPSADNDTMRWYQAYLAIPQEDRPIMRSFTVRDLTPDHLVIDFVLHTHGGPASQWATTARPGDTLARYGPAEEYKRDLPLTADWLLLAGDETALPAVGSLLPLKNAKILVEVANEAEEQPLPGVTWLHRNNSPHGQQLIEAVNHLTIPTTDKKFAWLAGEATTVRTLRRTLVAKGIPKTAIDFTGYWRTHLTQDDAPTEADMADAQERIAMMKADK